MDHNEEPGVVPKCILQNGVFFRHIGLLHDYIDSVLRDSLHTQGGTDQWASYTLRMFISWLETFLYFSVAYQMLIVCFNRYIAVVYFAKYRTIFTNRNIIFMIAVVILLSATLATGYVCCNCNIAWFLFAWTLKCTGGGGCQSQMRSITGVFSNIPTAGLPLIYVIIFWRVHTSKQQVLSMTSTNEQIESKRRERKLMIQFCVICIVHLQYVSSFWYIFMIGDLRVATVMVTLMQLLDSTINPIMYLLFSTDIRQNVPWKQWRTANQVSSTAIHPLTT